MKPLRIRSHQAVRLGLATLALTTLSTGAFAQISAEQQNAIRGNCRSDFMLKCSGVPRGGREALECLQKNVASLSPACKTAVSATMPAPAAPPPPAAAAPPLPPPAAAPPTPPTAAAPPPPAAAPKQTATPPQPKAVAPKAEKKKVEAPPPPPAGIAPAPIPLDKIEALPLSKRLAITRHCRADLDAVCSSVRRGGGRIIACLDAHRPALSQPCRTALERELR